MLQAIGLTSNHRRDLPPAVRDLTFEAPPGRVTVLLGTAGAGKSTALRLMLGLESGRGVTRFRGNPLHALTHPAREVGAVLGDVPGHPARTARGQLRMVCAAAGVPLARADEVLEGMGLTGLAARRLDTLSLGMDRKVGAAAALLGDPHTLILDEPVRGLPPRERDWWHRLLRAHADRGGTVLCTTGDPREAARLADRVIVVDAGRLVADRSAVDFSRTRGRPRVAVRTPHAVRLAELVRREARAAQRPVEAVTESGGLLSVYGSTCAEVGETAFRHGVLLHRLTEEAGDTPPALPREPGPGRIRPAADGVAEPEPEPEPPGVVEPPVPDRPEPRTPDARESRSPDGSGDSGAVPSRRSRPQGLSQGASRAVLSGPVWPVRYEVLRLTGVRTGVRIAGAAVLGSLVLCVLLARSAATPVPIALAAWPDALPLPPAALAAGLIGALSFGEEFRYPALAVVRGGVSRRLRLLFAKAAVTALAAVLIALLVAAADAQALRLVYGAGAGTPPRNWPALLAGWCGLSVGCAWAGLLAAGVFRVASAGVAAVLAVPVVIAPLVQRALIVPSVRPVAGFLERLRELAWVRLPHQADGWVLAGARVVAQPVGVALMLSLSVLICAYMFTGLRREASW
ncbi:ABC transporter ATP-binding protein [Streptomyces katsurahamanus]|uniref:ABC transporter ATP-binding protein n=1 Tax=Streptomyces katsurahamanus TaxID=2577098 RepID=A0ABW9NM81_9ACTN|nr:ABC transporter ATP-binding protein [Streptomyces katsurahamanus]MQS34425.1 ABC transporter ATP-binding protein [Streptomyces katsurahamanus]